VNWSIFADADDIDTDFVASARNRAFRDSACFPVCVDPATEKLVGVEIRRHRIE